MRFSLPEYYYMIHPHFKKYFSSKYFDGSKHYPQTIAEANNYVLKEIYNADKAKSFTINIKVPNPLFNTVESEKEFIEEKIKFNKENYKYCFNYDLWSFMTIRQKVIALYWLTEEIKAELDTPPTINFCFITCLDADKLGYYNHDFYANDFNINPSSLLDAKISAFSLIDTIAHELRHSQFGEVQQKTYMKDRNNLYYYPYVPSDDLVEDTYRYLMYFFQPTELDAHKFGLSYAYNLFSKITEKEEANFTDLYYFSSQKSEYRYYSKIKKLMFKGEFESHLDLYYLLDEFQYDLENPKLSNKRAQSIQKDMEEIEHCIEEDREKYKNNLIARHIEQAKADIKHI